MKRNIVATLLTVAMAATSLAGCGSSTTSISTSNQTSSSHTASTAAKSSSAAASSSEKTIATEDVATTSTTTSSTEAPAPGKWSDEAAVQKAIDEQWEIAVVPKDSTNPWFVRMKSGVDEFASETGVDCYQVDTGTIDATHQAQQVEDLIAQGVDAICVVPVDIESMDPILKKAKDAGITVITHEGADLKNVDYDIEAFSNAGYGAFLMQNLADAMGEEGTYTTMVASLTNGSHNEWADAAVEYQKEHYPNMHLLEENPRVESNDNGDTAYNVAKELIKTYPDLKGILGTSSFDAPGVARAIEELGLKGKFFTTGTGMPADNAEILKSGVVKSLTVWDPGKSGEAMVDLACKVLAGEKIEEPLNLNVEGYTAMTKREGSNTVFEGQGWVTVTADNCDSFGF
ncbi:autoinducer 2 ABC transporter substrate-binding protein [Bilifractor sp. LCP19S3_H10]|uniref:autoinducer 2 ABC transporter substrate-binding protein n=1 Tax=Bilifractor sp. LCP19S3_H10 TaxID=3438736 RepID=UPI003F8EE763